MSDYAIVILPIYKKNNTEIESLTQNLERALFSDELYPILAITKDVHNTIVKDYSPEIIQNSKKLSAFEDAYWKLKTVEKSYLDSIKFSTEKDCLFEEQLYRTHATILFEHESTGGYNAVEFGFNRETLEASYYTVYSCGNVSELEARERYVEQMNPDLIQTIVYAKGVRYILSFENTGPLLVRKYMMNFEMQEKGYRELTL